MTHKVDLSTDRLDVRDYTQFEWSPISWRLRAYLKHQVSRRPFLDGSFAPAVITPDKEGFDRSLWNIAVRPFPFQQLRDSGHRFCYLKASQGTTGFDPEFHDGWLAALDAGFIVGAYHYVTDENGADQADHFLEVTFDFHEAAKSAGRMLPDAQDVEDLSIPATRGPIIVTSWATYVSINGPIQTPRPYDSVAYSTAYHWSRITGNLPLPFKVAGWAAHWTPYPDFYKPVGWTDSETLIHQYGIANYHSWVDPIPYPGRLDKNRWLHSLSRLDDVTNISGDSTTPPVAEGLKFEVVQDGLRVRSGPGTNFSILRSLPAGAVVDALDVGGGLAWVEIAPGEWANVEYYGDINMVKVS